MLIIAIIKMKSILLMLEIANIIYCSEWYFKSLFDHENLRGTQKYNTIGEEKLPQVEHFSSAGSLFRGLFPH